MFELTDGTYRSLLPAMAIRSDPERQLDADDILNGLRENRAVRIETRYLNMLPSQGRYWAAFQVRNATPLTRTWVIDLRRPHLLEFRVDVDRGRGLENLLILELNAARTERPFDNRYHAFPLTLDAGEVAAVVIGYRSFATGWLDPHIGSAESMLRAHAQEDAANWLVTGILLAMIAFAALMLPVIGWPVGLAFIAYAAAGFMFVAHEDGYLFALGASSLRLPADQVGLLLALLMTTAALVFARTLFATARTQPRADRLYRVILGLLALVVLLLPLGYGFSAYHVSAYVLIVLTSFLHPVIGIAALRQGHAGARPFLVGSPFIVGSLLYSALAHLVPGQFSIEATLDFGQVTLIVEAFTFATAILMRTRNLQQERDEAAQQAMREANTRLLLMEALGDSERRFKETNAAVKQAHAKLATIGHDIRQPLLSLRTTLDRLAHIPPTADQRMREAFAYMETLARTAGSTDDEKAASLPEAREDFDVDVVLENAVGMFRNEAEEKGMSLAYEPSGARLTARPVLVMRIVNNLVANAVRHSGGRKVEVRIAPGTSRLEVADDGDGMDAAKLKDVQRSGVRDDTTGGDGLGLAIVRELADREGYAFELLSRPEEGTMARVTFA